jgi:hypothetical protein
LAQKKNARSFLQRQTKCQPREPHHGSPQPPPNETKIGKAQRQTPKSMTLKKKKTQAQRRTTHKQMNRVLPTTIFPSTYPSKKTQSSRGNSNGKLRKHNNLTKQCPLAIAKIKTAKAQKWQMPTAQLQQQ